MRVYTVDAFTDVVFSGNPAGVCLPDTELSECQMQLIAQELALSETAFVRTGQNRSDFNIRYFSPVMEIPLCGHATLAAAKILFEERPDPEIVFRTQEGLRLCVRSTGNGIVMEFPLYDTTPADAPPDLLASLGLDEVRNAALNTEMKILLLEIASPQDLAALDPDFPALKRSYTGINGVLVTAPSGEDGYDFHSRYFWPWSGTDEDPVTGGTHTFLARYWSDRLGKSKLRSFQSSRRTGSMIAEIRNGALYLTGNAVIVLRGEMAI